MKIFPAIDIIGGKVVRLCQGAYGNSKIYGKTPLEAAEQFAEQGAKYLHIVDLDGARSGNADNAKIIEEIVLKCGLFVEVGGGIRSLGQINKYLDCGIKRIILGTAAVQNFKFTEKAVEKFRDSIAVGVDEINGKIAINGWKEITDIDANNFCRHLKKIGVNNVIYTDISKDGMLNGTNLDIYKVLCQTEYPKITASGGITELSEIIKLKELGVYGAILGKALYENKLDLKAVINVAGDEIC